MQIDSGPNSTPEQLITIPFEEYREFCDSQSTSYRKVGIVDPESYAAAIVDPTTETITLETGAEVPLLVSSDYVNGYDIERTKRLTEKSDLFVLVAPVEVLEDGIELKGDFSDRAILVESDSKITDQTKESLPAKLRHEDESIFEVHEFLDNRIEDDDHKPAWIALYEGDVTTINGATEKKSLEQAFFDDGGEIAPENGYTLLSGPTLEEHPEIIDQLWDLFCDRFGWLGDFHPVSMEDTREWFDEFLTHQDTNTLIRYVDGEPKIAGFYQMDVDNCEWLNHANLGEHDEKPVKAFLAALAARDKDMNYSEEYVKFQCKMAALAGLEYRVSIESSNMSSQYIPRILEFYMSDSGYADVKIEQTKRQDYWFLTLG